MQVQRSNLVVKIGFENYSAYQMVLRDVRRSRNQICPATDVYHARGDFEERAKVINHINESMKWRTPSPSVVLIKDKILLPEKNLKKKRPGRPKRWFSETKGNENSSGAPYSNREGNRLKIKLETFQDTVKLSQSTRHCGAVHSLAAAISARMTLIVRKFAVNEARRSPDRPSNITNQGSLATPRIFAKSPSCSRDVLIMAKVTSGLLLASCFILGHIDRHA